MYLNHPERVHEHPVTEKTLSQDDDVEIVEELLPAKNQSIFLARKLKIPDHTVETIHKEHADQKERLYRVIQEFLKQVEPRPTWRVILDALRSSIVDLPRLAEEIERRHGFHTPVREPTSPSTGISPSTATAVVPYSAPEATAEAQSLVPTTQVQAPSSASTGISPSTSTAVVPYSAPEATAEAQSLVPTTQVSGYKFTLAELEAKIDELEGKFDKLRTNTLHALQWKNVIVNDVVYQLTTLKARELSEHKMFLKENMKTLSKHDDLIELFKDLNLYWNYLSPGLLEHLAKKFCLSDIKIEVQLYKATLEVFRAKTSLKLFCLIEVKYIGPTEEFCNLVANFKAQISKEMTLKDVEDFRRRYADHYSLYDFTLRLNSILPGSFIVSFSVPESIVEILRVNIPEEMLKVFGVTQLEIAGSCVYSDCESGVCPRPRSMSAPVISHSTLTSAKDRKLALTQQQLREKEILLMQKTAELTRAEETIRREQQQIQDMRQQETAKDRELTQAWRQLRRKETELEEAKDSELTQARQRKETDLVQAKDRELTQARRQLRRKEAELEEAKDRELAQQLREKKILLESTPALRKEIKEETKTKSKEILGLRAPPYYHSYDIYPRGELVTYRKKFQPRSREKDKPPLETFRQRYPSSGPTELSQTYHKKFQPTQSTEQELFLKAHQESLIPRSLPLESSGKKLYSKPEPPRYGQKVLSFSKKLPVLCHCKRTAPHIMIRGSATSDHQLAFFAPDDSYSVYSYEWSTEQWKELPSCPYRDSALVIINGGLTTVGGVKSGSDYTKKLFTLQQKHWVRKYPPMKNARSSPAAVSACDGDYIIVIGGRHNVIAASVELYQVKLRKWYELTNLPQPLNFPSATICGDELHVIGLSSGYSCSLQTLPFSDEPIAPRSLRNLISWTSLPHLPVTHSTASTLSGQPIIIGGKQDLLQVNSIHQLVEGKWVNISSMTISREFCLSVSPSPDRVMIVGGVGAENSVEEISVPFAT